ncbi:MAG: Holliday junction branch migration protein RuvA [Gemmatimonadota bacterium]|nr:Holliday junction branch migration protein RuvA [Gemmatimonadota bacterium]
MISRLRGTLLSREPDYVEVETAGGVVYEVQIPLSILEYLPTPPAPEFEIRILQVVREDSVKLYGFMELHERELFARLLGASGVGPKVALAMLSTYSAPRLARVLVEKDVNALKQVSGIGKKTAERIILELTDKIEDLAIGLEGESAGPSSRAQEAVAALVALGYEFVDADTAVRSAIADSDVGDIDELVRRVLAKG